MVIFKKGNQRMNLTVLIGRTTKDIELQRSTSGTAIARFTVAVNRTKEGADFIGCVAFGKTAENMEKYVKKGSKIAVRGHIQTGSYTNNEGKKVYTSDVIADNVEFIDTHKEEKPEEKADDDFMEIPDGIESELPFN